MGGTRATPAANATALHIKCHGNPHGTPMFTAPRLGLGLGLGLGSGLGLGNAVEVRGGFGGIPWKVLPQVVPWHATACREKYNDTP